MKQRNFFHEMTAYTPGTPAKEKLMSDAYVIELQGSAVVIIVRRNQSDSAYRFMASLHGFNCLEGEEFTSPFQAEKAARKLWQEKPHILRPASYHAEFND